MSKFKVGDLVVRKPNSGIGWSTWCKYLKDRGLPVTTPAEVVDAEDKNFIVSVDNRRIGTTWYSEWFDLHVQLKPLEDYM